VLVIATDGKMAYLPRHNLSQDQIHHIRHENKSHYDRRVPVLRLTEESKKLRLQFARFTGTAWPAPTPTDGTGSWTECFRPGLKTPRDCAVVLVPNSSRICVSHGNDELFFFDVTSFLLVGTLALPDSARRLCAVSESLYCALENGRILEIDGKKFAVVGAIENFANRKILRIGEYRELPYVVISDGSTFIFEDRGKPKQILAASENIVDVVLHRIHRRGLKIVKGAVMIVEPENQTGVALKMGDEPMCCCWDDAAPLCAIASEAGWACVWRIRI